MQSTDGSIDWLLAIRYLLLPNRPVPVLPSTLKETVMHHAHSEEQNQERENYHEEDRDDCAQWWLLLWPARRVRILIHSSRLNSCPRAGHDP